MEIMGKLGCLSDFWMQFSKYIIFCCNNLQSYLSFAIAVMIILCNQLMTENSQQTTALDTNQATKQPKKTKKRIHQAVMKLKQAEKHIDTVKRRCMVLKVHDEKNRYRTVEHQKKIQFLVSVKEQTTQEKLHLESSVMERIRIIDRIRERNQNLKEINRSRIISVRESLANLKSAENKQIRSLSKKNEQIIHEMHGYDVKIKQNRRKQIEKQEIDQKVHIAKFHELKIDETKQIKVVQDYELIKKLRQRQKQLQKLSSIEQEMIERNADSIQASQVMRSKLRQVLGTSIQGRAKGRLPEINSRASSHRHSQSLQIQG